MPYHVAADVRFLLVWPASLSELPLDLDPLPALDTSYPFRFFILFFFCVVYQRDSYARLEREIGLRHSPALYRASLWRLKVQLYASRKRFNCILHLSRVLLLRFNCWQSWAAYQHFRFTKYQVIIPLQLPSGNSRFIYKNWVSRVVFYEWF